jgi:hypothetical protein
MRHRSRPELGLAVPFLAAFGGALNRDPVVRVEILDAVEGRTTK